MNIKQGDDKAYFGRNEFKYENLHEEMSPHKISASSNIQKYDEHNIYERNM